jgi:hypothetical protein
MVQELANSLKSLIDNFMILDHSSRLGINVGTTQDDIRKTGCENIDRIELTVHQFVDDNSVSSHSIIQSNLPI